MINQEVRLGRIDPERDAGTVAEYMNDPGIQRWLTHARVWNNDFASEWIAVANSPETDSWLAGIFVDDSLAGHIRCYPLQRVIYPECIYNSRVADYYDFSLEDPEERAGKEFVSTTGRKPSLTNPTLSFASRQVGIQVAPKYRNQGVGKAALATLEAQLFTDFNRPLDAITAMVKWNELDTKPDLHRDTARSSSYFTGLRQRDDLRNTPSHRLFQSSGYQIAPPVVAMLLSDRGDREILTAYDLYLKTRNDWYRQRNSLSVRKGSV